MYTFSKKDKKPVFIRFLYFLLTKFALANADIYSVSSIDDQNFLRSLKQVKRLNCYQIG